MTPPLRSGNWFAASGKTGIMRRSWLRCAGPPDATAMSLRDLISTMACLGEMLGGAVVPKRAF